MTVAWDSAGVTTGPVTVPLVLSVGAGIANKANVTDGFGILACASVCPIISVLLMAILVLGWKMPDCLKKFQPREEAGEILQELSTEVVHLRERG